jgi:hypothetical protein
MKTTLKTMLYALSTVIILCSFQFDSNLENDKKIIGIWKGSEVEKEQKGLEKHWIVQRFSNGTYTIIFSSKQNCEISTSFEKGKWWTKGNVFYEKSENSETPDVYNYEIKDNLVIHFKSQTTDYEFDDYRLE